VDYYKELFTSVSVDSLSEAWNSSPQVVTERMNSTLTEDFQEWEVEAALKQMAPLKAPGPDGMPPLFYQNFWDLVRDDITSSVLTF